MKKNRYLGLAVAVMLLGGSTMAVEAAETGPYCREYTQKVMIGGQVRQAYGTACLQENRAWQIVSQQVDGNEGVAALTPVVSEPVVQYVETPVYVSRYEPEPWPVFLSLGYTFNDRGGWHGGHGRWHGGHGGGWYH